MTKEETRLADRIAVLDRSRGFADNFDRFIDFALFMFFANPTEEECRAFERHRKDKAYTEALQMLGELSEGYHDSLGDMFMERISHGSNSQFFTPEHICEFMAIVGDSHDESVADPTCGSGRLLLKGLQQSRANGCEPMLYGCDLDHRCTKVTLLNLCLNSARGDVEWGNSLAFTAYKTYHIDRVRINGMWMSFVWQYSKGTTDLVDLNAQRRRIMDELMCNGVMYEIPPVRRSQIRQGNGEITVPEVIEEVKVEKPVLPVQLEFAF